MDGGWPQPLTMLTAAVADRRPRVWADGRCR